MHGEVTGQAGKHLPSPLTQAKQCEREDVSDSPSQEVVDAVGCQIAGEGLLDYLGLGSPGEVGCSVKRPSPWD